MINTLTHLLCPSKILKHGSTYKIHTGQCLQTRCWCSLGCCLCRWQICLLRRWWCCTNGVTCESLCNPLVHRWTWPTPPEWNSSPSCPSCCTIQRTGSRALVTCWGQVWELHLETAKITGQNLDFSSTPNFTDVPYLSSLQACTTLDALQIFIDIFSCCWRFWELFSIHLFFLFNCYACRHNSVKTIGWSI